MEEGHETLAPAPQSSREDRWSATDGTDDGFEGRYVEKDYGTFRHTSWDAHSASSHQLGAQLKCFLRPAT